MHRLEFVIKTLSPCVLTSTSNATIMTGTHSAFSGSIIRGILSSRFVATQKLTDEAHDKTFREIFFGGLKFLPANPEVLGKRALVLPLSLQSGKAGTPEGEKIQDLLGDENPRRGYKNFRGFGVLDGSKIFRTQVKTNIFMHMSRSGEEERTAGRSTDGQIYNYEALDAEQIFRGEIIGDENFLRRLRDGLALDGDKMPAYVGRSKFTQYGKCLVTFGDIERLPAQNFSEKIFLRLDTPLIPVVDCFLDAEKILTAEIAGKLGKKFSVGTVFAAGETVENFVVPWGMKRPRVSALAAGSVFELKIASELTDDERKLLRLKMFEGFGLRTEEGFGQLRLWSPSDKFTRGTLDAEKPPRPAKFSDKTLELAKKILLTQLLEQVRIWAHEDAEALRPQLQGGNLTHFFARLDGLLSRVGKTNVLENFAAQLQSELAKGNALFKEHLNTLRMANGQKFFDVLTARAPLPIDSRSMSDELDLQKLRTTLFKDLNFSDADLPKDVKHWEYLKNYFRFARKTASLKGGKARE